MVKERRTVRLRQPISKGHGRVLWAYSYIDLAELAGVSVDVVRQDVFKGALADPGDLRIVLAWLLSRAGQRAIMATRWKSLRERVLARRPFEPGGAG